MDQKAMTTDAGLTSGPETQAGVKGAQGESSPTGADGRPPHYLEQFFSFTHLPAHLREVSAPFAGLAAVIRGLPDNPEKTTALRKLLEAKDCAVRSVLYKG